VWPATSKASFVSAFRGVAGARYTVANIILYVVTGMLGAVVYTVYRIAVRPYLESAQLWQINGSFELKEPVYDDRTGDASALLAGLAHAARRQAPCGARCHHRYFVLSSSGTVSWSVTC
jgi:hypothetical protein